MLLNLSSAFDTVDHQILLRRLNKSFGIGGVVLDWFQSYLTGRVQYVRCGRRQSSLMKVLYGLPQGSVLGPLLFILYTADLITVIESLGLCPHLYADDTQIQGLCSVGAADQFQLILSACLDEVASWMRANRLQLNPTKTEVLWCTTPRRQHLLPTSPVLVGIGCVSPSTSVRNL